MVFFMLCSLNFEGVLFFVLLLKRLFLNNLRVGVLVKILLLLILRFR